jgi:hypothetical protein
MKNVRVHIYDDVFNLVDDTKTIVFSSKNWSEVQDFAYGKINIQFEPKDLTFDLDPDYEEGPFVVFDIKYGSSEGSLGGHNVINLPSFIDSGELMECTFLYDESKSKQQVIDALVAAGASYEPFM